MREWVEWSHREKARIVRLPKVSKSFLRVREDGWFRNHKRRSEGEHEGYPHNMLKAWRQQKRWNWGS